MNTTAASALLIAFVGVASMCAAADDELFEEHHAHEHGVATLEVALEASQLVLQFRSPAMNLLGFEHRPRSAEDEAAVARAMGWLRDPALQFAPSPEANCRVAKSDVKAPHWEHSTGHSEFTAGYRFDCQRPTALQHLDVRLLQQLGTDVKIEVRVVSSEGQRSVELSRSNRRLALRTARQ